MALGTCRKKLIVQEVVYEEVEEDENEEEESEANGTVETRNVVVSSV